MLTDEKMKQWKAAIDKATPGPWSEDGDSVYPTNSEPYEYIAIDMHDDDAEFIALARTALPEAISEIWRLQSELRELVTKWCQGSVDGCDLSLFVGDASSALLDILTGPHEGIDAALGKL